MLGQQHLRGGDKPGLGIHRHAGRVRQLAPVGGNHVRTLIYSVVAALRVDDHLAPELFRPGDQLPGHLGAQHALAVVGEDGDGGRRHRIQGDAHQPLGQPRGQGHGHFAVGADQMLALGDVACLQRGGAPALHQQPGFHALLPADQSSQVRARNVVTHHGDKRCRGSQRDEVAHHIAGAAGHCHFARDGENGHRRLRADAGDLAVGEGGDAELRGKIERRLRIADRQRPPARVGPERARVPRQDGRTVVRRIERHLDQMQVRARVLQLVEVCRDQRTHARIPATGEDERQQHVLSAQHREPERVTGLIEELCVGHGVPDLQCDDAARCRRRQRVRHPGHDIAQRPRIGRRIDVCVDLAAR